MRDVNTDKAWYALHTKLGKDNLIPSRIEATNRFINFRRTAAIVALALVGSMAVLLMTTRTEKASLLSIKNTEKEQVLVTTLHDGSLVFLDNNASISYPEQFANDKRFVQVEGDVMFDIAKDPQRPFIIDTRHIQVEVLGTSFYLRSFSEQDAFTLSVRRGQVKVLQKNSGEFMLINAGETVQMEDAHLQKSITADSLPFGRYMEKMCFKDETLGHVLNAITSATGHHFVLRERELGNRLLTVAFENNDVRTMTDLICLTFHLNYVVSQDTTYISLP